MGKWECDCICKSEWALWSLLHLHCFLLVGFSYVFISCTHIPNAPTYGSWAIVSHKCCYRQGIQLVVNALLSVLHLVCI